MGRAGRETHGWDGLRDFGGEAGWGGGTVTGSDVEGLVGRNEGEVRPCQGAKGMPSADGGFREGWVSVAADRGHSQRAMTVVKVHKHMVVGFRRLMGCLC